MIRLRSGIAIGIALVWALGSAQAGADAPTSQPAASQTTAGPMEIERPLGELLSDLDHADPRRVEMARSELMLMELKDIDELKAAAREAALSDSQLESLHEIVSQIYITSQMPVTGTGWGFMGVTMPPIQSEDDPLAGLPAVIPGRVMGCDAYRVLREGDTVVGMQGITQAEPSMTSIGSYREMRAFLRKTTPGDWILIRVVRNGEPVELPLRLSLNNGARQADAESRLFEGAAERFWTQQFMPALKAESGGKSRPSKPAS